MRDAWGVEKAAALAKKQAADTRTGVAGGRQTRDYWLQVSRIIDPPPPPPAPVVVKPMTADDLAKMSDALKNAGFTCSIKQDNNVALVTVTA